MSFLNPSILIALSAVSIPILIHLLNLRKIRKVEFSTLMFLKEIQKSKMRRIKLKQVILLLLRIFTIVFLVLSFARPVYEGYAGNTDTRASSTTLIFIDDSFSMNARDNSGFYLDQAKEIVKKILQNHKESDDIYFIPSSQIAMKDKKLQYESYKEILDSLNALKYSLRPASVTEMLNLSDEILTDSKNPVKEIFIISDFQRNNFNMNLNAAVEFSNIKDNSVNTYLIDISDREVSNLSLDSFTVVSKILEKGKDIKVRINLNNHAPYNVSNKSVNLYVDGELKGEKAADVGSFGKSELEFIFNPGKAGNINGYIELVSGEFSEDEIIQDNKYYFTLNIPEKFDVTFIEDDPSDFAFIDLAFKTASEFLSDSIQRKSSLFNVKIERNVSGLTGADMVFISNKKSFTDSEAEVLKDYISNGGGVFLFLGNNIDINNYNNTILNKLSSLKIDKLNADQGSNANLKFDKVDFEHPVLSEIFRNKSLNFTSDNFRIETPKINSYYDLLINENAAPVITLSNGRPFLVETKFSKGKIMISAVPATNDLSDFPLKTIFVPLMIRSVYYLSNNFEYQQEYIAGNQNLIAVRGLKNVASVITPSGTSTGIALTLRDPSENFILLPYSHAVTEAGKYTMRDSSGGEYNFAMNVNSMESDLSVMSKEELKKYFTDAGINNLYIIEGKDDVNISVNESRTGTGLWKYFLLFALMFLAAELLLSKHLEKS